MFNQLCRKQHPIIAVILFLSPILSCGGDGNHPSRQSSAVTTLTVGIPLNDSVVGGGFNAYAVSVIEGSIYKLSMNAPSDDADLLYFAADNTFSALAGCNVDNTAIEVPSPEDCIVVAPAGMLYFGIDGTFLSTMRAVFTISVEEVAITDLNQTIPAFDSATQTGARAYALPVTPGSSYTIGITGLDNDADLYVFNNGTLTSPNSCTIDNTPFTGSTPEDCTLSAAGDTIYFIVDGLFSTSSAVLFTAFGTPAPSVPAPVNQGSAGSPIAVPLDTLTTGQVAFQGTSFYQVNGLVADARYTVSINGLTNDANLTVFDSDSMFTTPAACSIDNTLFAATTAEACSLTASGSVIYFSVSANTASGGVAFIAHVEPGP